MYYYIDGVSVLYTIWVVSPVNYRHSRAFNEVAECLRAAFVELGHEASIVYSSFECQGRTVVLGAHLLNSIPAPDIPMDLIIWNLEQIFPGSPWLTNEYVELLRGGHEEFNFNSTNRKLEVWDYSQSNIDELKKLGIEAKLMPVGYMPCLTRIENVPNPDIDVLFVGSLNERRQKILDDLHSAGLKVLHAVNCYGLKRDSLIARAKIVLNVHFYESRVFEIVRCSYLMANRKCVVSESGEVSVPYDSIVSTCVDLVGNDFRREEMAQMGFESFSKEKQSVFLKEAL